MSDVPTLTDPDTSNFATLNPLGTNDISTFSEANLKVTTGSGASTTGTTIPMSSGKWYAEFVCTAKTSVNMYIGLVEASTFDGDNQGDEGTNNGYIYSNTGNIYHGFANEAYGASWTVGDVMAIAFDADTRNVIFYKNNVSQGVYTRIASENTGGDWLMVVSEGQGGATATFVANFGQRPFAYTPPTGFKKLNTFNLPDSTVKDGSEYFNTVLYSGTGDNLNRSIAGVGFQPDWVWQKRRSSVSTHALYDSVRGSGSGKAIATNLTHAEGTVGDVAYGYISSFDSDGFSTTKGTVNNDIFNVSGHTFVAWNWKANGTAVSNTDGTIASQVSANTTAGFSIVTYTGNATAGATVGHGLGVAPAMVIVKSRSATESWEIAHQSLAATQTIRLNSTAAASTTADFNSTRPSATVFTIGSFTGTNQNSGNYVAYCFAEVEGYSKFGSYTGNGSADGPFVYTGFRPAWIIVKGTSNGGSWHMWDNKRSPYNVSQARLLADTSDAESSFSGVNLDMLSNGFKLKNSDGAMNGSARTYIYMAFAENPFKNSNAR